MSTGAIDTAMSGRSARKHAAILGAGQQLFLQKGFARTTMDEVAATAQVSKPTVYSHFADKESLFTAIVTAEIDSAELLTHDQVAALGDSLDIERDLRRFARRHVRDVTQPHVVRLRRMVIAEAEQFPELARAWYASGPERAHRTLAAQLEQLHRRGLLDVRDPSLAAQHLNWLIISIPLNEAMFSGESITFEQRRLQRYADEAVRVFLAAYRPRP